MEKTNKAIEFLSAGLKVYGLSYRESDSPDRDEVDFTIEDKDDNVAYVWGHSPSDVDWECNHPHQCIEFGSDREEQGECMLCGAWCDWHYSADEEGHGYPEAHEWYPRRDVGGLIGRYLKELA